LSNECDISHNTAKAWLSILEGSYIVFLLQPYHQNFNKLLIKSPKLYFYDTGLLTHLLGIRTAEELEENRLKGNIFENMILAEYQKQNQHQYLHQDHYFWQDSNAHEVDLLMKKGQGFSIFEIKATQTISTSLFKEMDRFEDVAAPIPVNKTLIYAGAENEKRTRYNILSWQNVSEKSAVYGPGQAAGNAT
jgi:predicted AAA+ superfamily ATPase